MQSKPRSNLKETSEPGESRPMIVDRELIDKGNFDSIAYLMRATVGVEKNSSL